MKKEKRKFGWELTAKSFEDLNKFFKVEGGKIAAWYCFESEEWVSDGFKCSCGTTLGVGEFTERG